MDISEKKWKVAIAVALGLGLISEIIWEFLGPMLVKSCVFFFTLGHLFDNSYREPELVVNDTSLTSLGIGMLLMGVSLWFAKNWMVDPRELKEALSFLNRIEKATEETQKFRERLNKKITKSARDWAILKFITIIFLIFISFSFIINSAFMTSRSAISRQFNNSLNICKPYISDKKEEMFISNYLQVNSRQDYINIMEELYEIAKKNNQHPPTIIIY